MPKTKLKLLFFIAFSLTTNSIISMGDENSLVDPFEDPNSIQQNENLDDASSEECGICFEDLPQENFYALSCRHKFCKICIEDYLNDKYKKQVVPDCPACRRIFESSEYDGLMQINRTLATKLKKRHASQNSNFRQQNINHNPVRPYNPISANDKVQPRAHKTGFQLSQAIKILIIPFGIAGYILYQFTKKNNNSNAQAEAKTRDNLPNWIAKKFSSLKKKIGEYKSDVYFVALTSAGLFALLELNSVDLTTYIDRYFNRGRGNAYWRSSAYWQIGNSGYSYKKKINKAALVNGVLSLSAGVIGRYIYKLYNCNNYKPRNKPRPLSAIRPVTNINK